MSRQHRRITTAIALTLALTVSAATAALADPPPLKQAEGPIAANHSQASTPVQPNPDEQTATPTATTPYTGPCSEVCSGNGYGLVSRSLSAPNETGAALPHDSRPRPAALSSAYTTATTPRTIVRVVAPDVSFDWGDAGIGAGAALVLVGVGLAGVRAATNGRHAREHRATASS